MSSWLPVGYVKTRLAATDPTGTHRSDPLLADVAAEACAWLERKTGLHFKAQEWTRTFARAKGIRLHLPETPVVSVSSLEVGTTLVGIGTVDDFRLGISQAFFDSTSINYPSGFCGRMTKVTWRSGYELGEIPEDVLGLATTVAVLKFKERDRFGVTKDVGGQDIIRELSGIELDTLNGLVSWRRMYVEQGA